MLTHVSSSFPLEHHGVTLMRFIAVDRPAGTRRDRSHVAPYSPISSMTDRLRVQDPNYGYMPAYMHGEG